MRFGPVGGGAGLLALFAGCGGPVDGAGGRASSAPPERRTLDVAAAAPPAAAFTELESRFEEVRPCVDVVFDVRAPADVARAVVDGGPADLVAGFGRP